MVLSTMYTLLPRWNASLSMAEPGATKVSTEPAATIFEGPPVVAKVNTPAVEIHTISHYDDKGPFWAWNWLKLGEHSGTHFDAPQHWITGKDYPDGATDTIPAQNFVGPVNVIDCSAEVAAFGSIAAAREALSALPIDAPILARGPEVAYSTWEGTSEASASTVMLTEPMEPATPPPSARSRRSARGKRPRPKRQRA